VKRATELFARGNKAPAAEDAQKVIDDLHRKIGQLQVECDFLAGQPAISRVLSTSGFAVPSRTSKRRWAKDQERRPCAISLSPLATSE
jgi:hypothetical protein